MENEFVPINISDNSNFDKKVFDDLTPCYSTGIYNGTDGNGNENNENTNSNSFTILNK